MVNEPSVFELLRFDCILILGYVRSGVLMSDYFGQKQNSFAVDIYNKNWIKTESTLKNAFTLDIRTGMHEQTLKR